jgi:hypothetical protein
VTCIATCFVKWWPNRSTLTPRCGISIPPARNPGSSSCPENRYRIEPTLKLKYEFERNAGYWVRVSRDWAAALVVVDSRRTAHANRKRM